MLITTFFTILVEKTINQLLTLDRKSSERLAQLQGKVIAIACTDRDNKFYFLPQTKEVKFFSYYSGSVDAWIKGKSIDLLQILYSKNFSGNLELSGNMEVVQLFREAFKELDINWEEQLAYFTGDTVAHAISSGLGHMKAWGQQALPQLPQDIATYLQENNVLPMRADFINFTQGISTLRYDVDRLFIRLQRLQDLANS